MPFTANRQFKKAPRLLARAEGMHYWDDRRAARSSTAWPACGASTPATTGRSIVAGDPGPGRRDGLRAALPDGATPRPSSWPTAWPRWRPTGMNKVFFTNSGSESVETALKMALAYHRVRGEGARTRLIGRERGYHGVNFGGISVGGIVGQPQDVRHPAQRRRPPPPHPRPGAQRLQRRPAGAWRRTGRRPGAPGRAARRRRPSPPSSSSRWPAPPACWCRRRATCSACARSATSTASC